MLARPDYDRLRVLRVTPRNPLNIGAAARAMSNFGFLRLRVVNPYQVGFREARSAVGAGQVLANAEEFATLAEAIADCTLVVGTTSVGPRDIRNPLHVLAAGARQIRKHLVQKLCHEAGEPARANNIALLFGSEKFGLSNEDLSRCHWLIRIPTREEHRSVNLGQAVAICLYEIARDAKSAPSLATPKKNPATASEIERLTVILFDVLSTSGYLKPRSAAPSQEKIRHLVRRLRLTAADAQLALGMLRKIKWKLQSADDRGAQP
ncbi:MAG: TrmH family RNA methyltransferase [Candidatus Acidiferrales bacterium]